MIKVPLREGDNIERALKKFKTKCNRVGLTKELRKREQYEKPSEEKRRKMAAAIYRQKLHDEED